MDVDVTPDPGPVPAPEPGRTSAPEPAGRPGPAEAVVDALTAAGLLAPARRGEALAVAGSALAADPVPADPALAGDLVTPADDDARAPLRRRLVELTGYVGGALVVAAATLIVGQQWADLSMAVRITLLGGVGVVLAAAAAVVIAAAGGVGLVRSGARPWHRRLASVLLTGAAPAVAGAVALAVEATRAQGPGGRTEELAAIGAFVAVAAAGYLSAPTLLGQVALAGGVAALVPALLQMTGRVHSLPLGVAWMAAGGLWWWLAWGGRWREVAAGRVIGALFVLVGAQTPLDSGTPWVAYVLTLGVAVLAFAGSVRRPEWLYPAVGVAALTLAVPEALGDWTDGSLGAAGVLLVAGLTLLGASLAASRLRRDAAKAAGTRVVRSR